MSFAQIKLEHWRRMKWLLLTYLLQMVCVLRYSIDSCNNSISLLRNLAFNIVNCSRVLTSRCLYFSQQQNFLLPMWFYQVLILLHLYSPRTFNPAWHLSFNHLYIHSSPNFWCLCSMCSLRDFYNQTLSMSLCKLRCFSGFPLWPRSWRWSLKALLVLTIISAFNLICSPLLSVYQTHWFYGSFSGTKLLLY